jgi:predicted 3-demethylubiquinone-9 3-methyltransferase (glyoxalase superfamily)
MATVKQKIVPHLWYDKEAKEAAEFYCSIEQIARVTQAFLKMKKFDLAELQRAYERV